MYTISNTGLQRDEKCKYETCRNEIKNYRTQFKSETGVQWVGLPSGDKLFPKIFVTDECYYNDCRY